MPTSVRLSAGTVKIEKIDEDQRIAYGWASVIEKDGEPLVDSHGHTIDETELVRAAHVFVSDARTGKVMHHGTKIAEVVDSIVMTRDVQKAMGVDLGVVGWFIGMQINDADIWKRVKDGELRSFSIGGEAIVRQDA